VYTLETLVHDGAHAPAGEQREQLRPHLRHARRLVLCWSARGTTSGGATALTRVRAPVDADDADVLEEDEVERELLDPARREADDDGAALPRDALHAVCARVSPRAHRERRADP
jgi:hypothetical protein